MQSLLGKNIEELQELAAGLGLPRFVGKQIAQWIYQKRVSSIDEMTNLSKAARSLLAEQYEVGRRAPVRQAASADGTLKYLFPTSCGQMVETVYIPDEDRATLCVSTQAGCKMHCAFCMTGTLGFHGQLTAADILNQIFSIPQADTLTNLVYMGEGEPMDNVGEVLRSLQVMTAQWGCLWSPRRITVSSVGLIPGLKTFLELSECHLAISLHNPIAAEREQIMPAEKAYPIEEVLHLIRKYDFRHQRRLSFEYIVFDGVNDTMRHLVAMQKLLRDLPCRVNLIRFHGDAAEGRLHGATQERMEQIRDYLTQNGITTTIRRSRGEDIQAACGMLVAREGQGGGD